MWPGSSLRCLDSDFSVPAVFLLVIPGSQLMICLGFEPQQLPMPEPGNDSEIFMWTSQEAPRNEGSARFITLFSGMKRLTKEPGMLSWALDQTHYSLRLLSHKAPSAGMEAWLLFNRDNATAQRFTFFPMGSTS